MEAPRIAPVIPKPDVRRVSGRPRGGSPGGFEQAFDQEREGLEASADAGAEQPAPSRLQPSRAHGRKNQDDGDHTIDVLV